MVSKASDDLPEPDSPVKTMSWSRGSSRSTLRRLCSRAPRITIVLLDGTATGPMIPGRPEDRTDVRTRGSAGPHDLPPALASDKLRRGVVDRGPPSLTEHQRPGTRGRSDEAGVVEEQPGHR